MNSPLELVIERATGEDIPQILAVQRRAFAAEAAVYGAHIAPMIETAEALAAIFDSSVILKGTFDGRIVASVRARLDKNNVCQVGRLSVDPDFQNRGFAKAIMRAVAAVYPECTACELFTGAQSEKNIGLYETLGFRRCGGKVAPDGTPLVILRLEFSNAG